jgi:hypothetical protein
VATISVTSFIYYRILTGGGDKYQLELNWGSTVVQTTVEQVELFKFNFKFSLTWKWRLNGPQVLTPSGSWQKNGSWPNQLNKKLTRKRTQREMTTQETHEWRRAREKPLANGIQRQICCLNSNSYLVSKLYFAKTMPNWLETTNDCAGKKLWMLW